MITLLLLCVRRAADDRPSYARRGGVEQEPCAIVGISESFEGDIVGFRRSERMQRLGEQRGDTAPQ
jgi:hypothetical protein